MLAYTDPARIPGLADPVPWRPPGTRTAGLIQAGIARLLRGVGLPALVAAMPPEFRSDIGRSAGRPPPEPRSPADPTLPYRPHRPAPTPRAMAAACKLQTRKSPAPRRSLLQEIAWMTALRSRNGAAR